MRAVVITDACPMSGCWSARIYNTSKNVGVLDSHVYVQGRVPVAKTR